MISTTFVFSSQSPENIFARIKATSSPVPGATVVIYYSSVTECNCYVASGKKVPDDFVIRLGLTEVFRRVLSPRFELIQ